MKYLIYDPMPDNEEDSPTARIIDTATGLVYDYWLANSETGVTYLDTWSLHADDGGRDCLASDDAADKLWAVMMADPGIKYVNPSESEGE